ncbi:hypothetical protein EV652_113186 [Kribbella steppae]|uniref:Uncharacterized protein n=1 Tax=Kribbella steppae TaxID=2512223 RepID=A0A4V2RYE7_9ACTN|nr:hypothetical protein [Kribbella steppae]TCO19787.1 hypothetical protein EV652_113186 [Kribbella steppae]
MSVFDMLKNKASELLQGASEKVSDATGIDLPVGDAADQVTQATDGLGETAQGYADTAGEHVDAATGLDLPVDGVADQVTQATDGLGEAVDPGQKP